MDKRRGSLKDLLRWSEPQVLIALTMLAAILCLLLLGHKSMWLDEGHSISFAKASLPRLWEIVTERQANMGIYYLMLHFWIIPAEGEVWIRLLSVIPAVATVPLGYFVAKRLFGGATATIAGVLLAINTFLVRYAQEARAYSLVMFLVTLSTLLFLRATSGDGRRLDRIWYVLTGVLAVYAHFYAVLVLAAHGLSLLVSDGTARRLYERVRPLLVPFVSILVLSSPLIYFVLFKDTGQIDWISNPTLEDLRRAMSDLVGEFGTPLLLAYGVLWALGAAASARSRDGMRALVLMGAWLLLPVVISFSVSYLKPIFLPRYLIVSVPAVAILAARGITSLADRRILAAVLALVTTLTGVGLFRYYADYEKENWKDAADLVLDEAQPGDGIIIYAGRLRKPFEYYVSLHDAEDEAPEPLYPDAPWGTFRSGGVGSPLGVVEGSGETRLWLVLSHVNSGNARTVAQQIHAEVLDSYVLVAEYKFSRVKVELYEPPG